jgi:hypothetical protein
MSVSGVDWRAFSSVVYSPGFFRWFILLSVHPAVAGGPFDQCDHFRKRRSDAAQSKASLAKKESEQVRRRALIATLQAFKDLFPSFQLNHQTESLRFAAPGAHAPQINGQLPRHSYDRFFAGRAGG